MSWQKLQGQRRPLVDDVTRSLCEMLDAAHTQTGAARDAAMQQTEDVAAAALETPGNSPAALLRWAINLTVQSVSTLFVDPTAGPQLQFFESAEAAIMRRSDRRLQALIRWYRAIGATLQVLPVGQPPMLGGPQHETAIAQLIAAESMARDVRNLLVTGLAESLLAELYVRIGRNTEAQDILGRSTINLMGADMNEHPQAIERLTMNRDLMRVCMGEIGLSDLGHTGDLREILYRPGELIAACA